jgi:hypothetical protein
VNRLLILCLFTVATGGIIHAQEYLLDGNSGIDMTSNYPGHTFDTGGASGRPEPLLQTQACPASSLPNDSGKADTAFHPVQARLLPENISFMEHGLWGESGLFRKIGIASPLSPETRKSEIGLRRTMLTAHQVGGFLTLGLMLGAAYTGQQIIDGRDQFRGAHQAFVASTIGSYSVTALLAVLSPPPLIRRNEVSTTTIHKTLAWVHFVGMVVTPILGAAISRRTSSYQDQARIHQVSAYITTGTFAVSMIVLFF